MLTASFSLLLLSLSSGSGGRGRDGGGRGVGGDSDPRGVPGRSGGARPAAEAGRPDPRSQRRELPQHHAQPRPGRPASDTGQGLFCLFFCLFFSFLLERHGLVYSSVAKEYFPKKTTAQQVVRSQSDSGSGTVLAFFYLPFSWGFTGSMVGYTAWNSFTGFCLVLPSFT